MKINLVQYNPAWENKEESKRRILNLIIKNIPSRGILILPEMTLTGFSMNPEKLAEDKDGETFSFFKELAEKFSVDVIGGIIEKEEKNYFNSLIHIDSSCKIVNNYKKIHPFSFSEEDKHYTAGKSPVVTNIDGWKVGLSICYDLRFPELFRFYAKERVELIIVAANWPITRIEHWRTLLKARAIENQCYVAGVNRVGNDPKLAYNGFSSIYDPMGKELIFLEEEEKIISFEIEKEKVEEVRSKLPFLNDIHLI